MHSIFQFILIDSNHVYPKTSRHFSPSQNKIIILKILLFRHLTEWCIWRHNIRDVTMSIHNIANFRLAWNANQRPPSKAFKKWRILRIYGTKCYFRISVCWIDSQRRSYKVSMLSRLIHCKNEFSSKILSRKRMFSFFNFLFSNLNIKVFYIINMLCIF